jgi:hypothetical protein
MEDGMSESLMFGTGLLATLAIAVVVIAALREPLEHLLTDLCGTSSRARFWAIFSAVTLAVVPLTFALNCDGLNRFTPPVLQIGSQVKWGLIGLLLTVLVMGWVLSRWIARHVPKA